MSKGAKTPPSQSWRDINQTVNQRTMTKQGRRRWRWNIVRTISSTMVCGGIAVLGVYLYRGYQSPETTLASVSDKTPLRDIVVLTDGTLTEAWARERLALPEGIPLMSIDLETAKQALEAARQVRTAVVTRYFPSTLLVTLEERAPIVQIMVANDPARPEPMFVARDGVAYRGYHYDRELEARLPWLDGVRLVRDGDNFAPISGLETVYELLLVAMQDAPHLAESFRVVSLAESPQLLVQIAGGPEAVFGSGDFRVQLARLDYVLDLCRQEPLPRGRPGRIDLSLGPHVVVQVAPGTTEPASPAIGHTLTRNVINQPQNRDF